MPVARLLASGTDETAFGMTSAADVMILKPELLLMIPQSCRATFLLYEILGTLRIGIVLGWRYCLAVQQMQYVRKS
jgi:hypothetical protein